VKTNTYAAASVMTVQQSRLAIIVSNLGHLFTHTFTILYATAVLHLPTVFSIPYGEIRLAGLLIAGAKLE